MMLLGGVTRGERGYGESGKENQRNRGGEPRSSLFTTSASKFHRLAPPLHKPTNQRRIRQRTTLEPLGNELGARMDWSSRSVLRCNRSREWAEGAMNTLWKANNRIPRDRIRPYLGGLTTSIEGTRTDSRSTLQLPRKQPRFPSFPFYRCIQPFCRAECIKAIGVFPGEQMPGGGRGPRFG